MKHIILTIVTIILAIPSAAQVVVDRNALMQYENVNVKATILDSKTSEPIPYVSVYLIPQGDTTITDFAISDPNGKVILNEVTAGRYEINAELIGYVPFKKMYDISQASGWDLDLGTIGMEENTEMIDASSITAAGNPITIQNDTIIYHASSFVVGENAMLEDLLKKMPGMEVGNDGSVTVNGKKVDRITVGGKTFFFDDPSIAIKNLPAKIVEKIKVSDENSKQNQMQGISTGMDEETVMDVELKEEYRKGWFGNAKLGGGATLNGKETNPLTEETKAIYNDNAMLSGYGEKDQVVFIANAYNAMEPGADQTVVTMKGMPEDVFTEIGGLTASVQAGANYNTSRIKNLETTVSATYKHTTKDDKRHSLRTSYTGTGNDLLTEGGNDALGKEDQLTVALEFSKQNGKLQLEFDPRFYFRKSSVNESNFSNTFDAGTGALLNSLSARSFSDNRQFLASGYLDIRGTELGESGRMVGLSMIYSGGMGDGSELENSSLNLDYDKGFRKMDIEGQMFYYEPLSSRWVFQAILASKINSGSDDRNAFNMDGSRNNFYTTISDKRYMAEEGALLMRYTNDTSTVQFGIQAAAFNDVVDAISMGKSTIVGKNQWDFNYSPIVAYSYSKGGNNFSAQYSGGPEQVSSYFMMPTLDIANPVQITAGNMYLKSGYSNNIALYYDHVNYKTYTFLTAYLNGSIHSNPAVYASWFDDKGVRYEVPVNSQKPTSSASAYVMFNQPFGKKKNFTFSFAGQFMMNRSHSYQAVSHLAGIDLMSFDYQSFMQEFWGNADGDKFYSGQSGFAESLTNTYDCGIGLTLKYNNDWFSGTLTSSIGHSISHYSLDPTANMNTWKNLIGSELTFMPGKGWEIGNDLSYVFYYGYANGYGKPELRWNMRLAKTIKSVTFGVKAADILNQTRTLNRIVSAEYVEDTYSNVMGRILMFNISFNFGRLNPKKNAAISNAMQKLAY